MILTPAITSVIKHVFLQDSAVTTGAGKTGLLYSGVTAYYIRAGGSVTALTMQTITTIGTWANAGGNDYLGFKLVDDTNMPGLYEIQLPNNILAAGANQITIMIKGTGIAPCQIEIQLASVPANLMSILGTALTETAGYLAAGFKAFFNIASPVLTTASVNQTGDSYNVVKSGGAGDNTAIKNKTDNLPASPAAVGSAMLITPGTGTGQLDITAGVVKANLVQILAAAITGTAANLVAAFTKWFNVATPTGTVNSLPDAVPGATNGLAIVGTKNPATLASTDVTGNLPAQVKAIDNIDFPALQKTSLNAATPASVQSLDNTVEGSLTLNAVLRIILAAVAGKTTTGQTKFRNVADTKDRIAAVITGGDRASITLDGS